MALTAERLRALLRYDPETGIFTWRVNKSNKRAGERAGGKNRIYGYWWIRVDRSLYSAHRLVWLYVFGRWPSKQIDHINGIAWDNRLANLREATFAQNKANNRARRKSSLGVRGVRRQGRWFVATVRHKGVDAHYSKHETLADAAAEYVARSQEIFGEFAGVEMNYSSLVGDKNTAGSIARWVNYSKLDGDVVLGEAQAILTSLLRVREMVTRDVSLAMNIGDFSKPLPANFLDPIHLCDAANNHYELRTPKDLLRRRVIDQTTQAPVQGQPLYWSVFDEALQFECSFNVAVGMQLMCYKSPAPLSNSNQTNFLTSRYPHLLRKACVLQAWDFMRNETEYAKAKADLEEAIALVNAEADLVFRSASYDTQLQ